MGFFDSITKGLGGMFTGLNPLNIDYGKTASTFGDFFSDPLGIDHQKQSLKMQQDSIEKSYSAQMAAVESQKQIASDNLALQKEAYEYQKALNTLNMEREDNAVQRRIADLKASGLSPILAAGSPANATPVRAGVAPQASDTWAGTAAAAAQNKAAMKMAVAERMQEFKMQQVGILSSLVSNAANISKTMAETQLIKANTPNIIDKAKAEAEGLQIANDYARDANPAKLKGLFADLSLKEQSLINSRLDEALKNDEHMYNGYRVIRADLENTYLSKQISEKDLDILSKTLAYEYYSSLGIPEGAFGIYGKDAAVLGKSVSNLIGSGAAKATNLIGSGAAKARKVGNSLKESWNRLLHSKGGIFDYTE